MNTMIEGLDAKVERIVNLHTGLTAGDINGLIVGFSTSYEIKLALGRLFRAGRIGRSLGRIGKREVYLYEPKAVTA